MEGSKNLCSKGWVFTKTPVLQGQDTWGCCNYDNYEVVDGFVAGAN